MDTVIIIQVTSDIIALIIGTVSFVMTCKQNRLSNKLNLFDKRFKVFETLNDVGNLCSNNLNIINSETKSLLATDYIASLLTNSDYLFQAYSAFDDIESIEAKRILLRKLNEIRNVANQSKFLFPDKQALYISDYLNTFANLLDWLNRCNRYQKEEQTKTPPSDLNSIINDEVYKTIRTKISEYKNRLVVLQTDYSEQLNQIMELTSIKKG